MIFGLWVYWERKLKSWFGEKRYCGSHTRHSSASCSLACLAAEAKGECETRIVSVLFSIVLWYQSGEDASVQPHCLSSMCETFNSVAGYFPSLAFTSSACWPMLLPELLSLSFHRTNYVLVSPSTLPFSIACWAFQPLVGFLRFPQLLCLAIQTHFVFLMSVSFWGLDGKTAASE